MFKKSCQKCGKVIEGYSENHVIYLLAQHDLKHKLKGGKSNVKEEIQKEE